MKQVHQSFVERDLAAVKAAELKVQTAVARHAAAKEKADLVFDALLDAKRTLSAATERFHKSVEVSMGSNGPSINVHIDPRNVVYGTPSSRF